MSNGGLGRSPKRGEGGSPTLSPGMDAGRVCPRALQGRKANQAYTALHHGKGFGVRARNLHFILKITLFLLTYRL